MNTQRRIRVSLTYHPDNQFPLTVKDNDGNNVCELPKCALTNIFFNVGDIKPLETKKVWVTCEDELEGVL